MHRRTLNFQNFPGEHAPRPPYHGKHAVAYRWRHGACAGIDLLLLSKFQDKFYLPKNLKVDLSYISFILLYTQTCSANGPQKRTPTISISRSPNLSPPPPPPPTWTPRCGARGLRPSKLSAPPLTWNPGSAHACLFKHYWWRIIILRSIKLTWKPSGGGYWYQNDRLQIHIKYNTIKKCVRRRILRVNGLRITAGVGAILVCPCSVRIQYDHTGGWRPLQWIRFQIFLSKSRERWQHHIGDRLLAERVHDSITSAGSSRSWYSPRSGACIRLSDLARRVGGSWYSQADPHGPIS